VPWKKKSGLGVPKKKYLGQTHEHREYLMAKEPVTTRGRLLAVRIHSCPGVADCSNSVRFDERLPMLQARRHEIVLLPACPRRQNGCRSRIRRSL
jgi:hypothetical protein